MKLGDIKNDIFFKKKHHFDAFQNKNTLKNNLNYTPKQALNVFSLSNVHFDETWGFFKVILELL